MDADVAEPAFAVGRTSAAVDNTIPTGAPSDGCAAADTAGAGARAAVAAAAGGVAILLMAGAIAEPELDATLTGAGVGATLVGRERAFPAACARLAAPAVVLLLSSSSGGKFGKVLSGT